MTERIPVINPRSGASDYSIRCDQKADIRPLADSLRQSQKHWLAASIDARVATMREFAVALKGQQEAIVSALAVDTGRHAIAAGEFFGLLGAIERWCGQAPALLSVPSKPSSAVPGVVIETQLDPYPLVGAISPWNFPLLLSFIDAVPALLAGCAAVIKPSEVTPRFASPVSDAIAAVPALHNVLRFIEGDGRTGAALIESVDVVAFTGSVATGKKVSVAAASRLIPAFLELGGKDPAIVLQGADVERATTAILRASVAATGQACQSLERIYVHTSIYDEFVAMLAQKAADVSLSYPDAHKGIVGPLIFNKQADIIRDHLEDAVEKGAVVHAGGEVTRRDGGFWVAPTVLSSVDHTMRVMTEETFGPIMPVMAFDSVDESLTLANDTIYGLSAAVFGPDMETALAVARCIDAGGISVNDAGMTTMIFEAEKSAYGMSGIGPSRMGATGLTRFLRHKALYKNSGDTVPISSMAESGGA
ncbi:MAG: aldehyde dehydrogenase family protein [Woeseiaceae bacterium]